MERGNTTTATGGALAAVTDSGETAAEVNPCPWCGMQTEEPTDGVACTICGETPDATIDTGPTALWECDICGESTGADADKNCLSCGMELADSSLPPEMPSMSITNPDGTTTTVQKNLDGTVTTSGAPPPGTVAGGGGGMAALDPLVDWRALSTDADGNEIHAGYGPLGNRLVRTTRPDGSGTIRIRISEETAARLAPWGGANLAGEHVGQFDAAGNITGVSGAYFASP